MTATAWLKPPHPLPPEEDTVDVWRVRLDVPALRSSDDEALLSPDEQERARRYLHERARRHYARARATLRLILARYLDRDPRRLTFTYSAHGKPQLADAEKSFPLEFNLAHARDYALVAAAKGRLVGVDLEHTNRELDVEGIARRFFAPRETATLLALPAAQRREAFFNGWARKEAYVKAKGTGLTMRLDAFEVSLVPGEPARLLAHEDSGELGRWALRALDPGPGYVGAVAAEGAAWDLRCWQWGGD